MRGLRRVGNCGRRMILTSDRVPAYLKKVGEHAYTITEWMEPAPFRVCPINRNFHDSQARLACEVQQFRVKPPGFNLLLREDQLSRRPAKSFESALRVFEIQSQHQS